jgi:hypothetical protein
MKLNLFFLSAAALVSAATAVGRVNLGDAEDYVILAKSGIDGLSLATGAITGSIGVSPIALTAVTSMNVAKDTATGQFALSDFVTEKVFAADFGGAAETALTTAVGLMEAAYTDAAGRANTKSTDSSDESLPGGDLSGLTLSPGVYTFDTGVSFTGLTLEGTDASSGPTDIFIIRTTGSLKAAGSVTLLNGVKPENVFWQVAEYVEVAATVTFNGILLVKNHVTFLAGATLNGRVLTQMRCDLKAGVTITEPDPVPTADRRSLRGNN